MLVILLFPLLSLELSTATRKMVSYRRSVVVITSMSIITYKCLHEFLSHSHYLFLYHIHSWICFSLCHYTTHFLVWGRMRHRNASSTRSSYANTLRYAAHIEPFHATPIPTLVNITGTVPPAA